MKEIELEGVTKNGDMIFKFFVPLNTRILKEVPQGSWLLNALDKRVKGKFVGVTSGGYITICWFEKGADNKAIYERMLASYTERHSERAKVLQVFSELRSAAQARDFAGLVRLRELMASYSNQAGELYYADTMIERLARLPENKAMAAILLED